MPVTLTITEISLSPKNDRVAPSLDRASVKVTVNWAGASFPLTFGVQDYSDLDDIAEKVRHQILDFANQMGEAASLPLRGSQRSP